MLLAIISDSHDNIWNLAEALRVAQERGAEALLHCGDFCAPFIMDELAKFGGPVHVVFGNVDGDIYLIMQRAAAQENVRVHGRLAELEIEGRKIAMHHYPDLARPLAESGKYDLVCYGHTHKQHLEQIGPAILLNPGEIMGRLGEPTLCLYDTRGHEVEVVTIGRQQRR